jgi:hypothetical protein
MQNCVALAVEVTELQSRGFGTVAVVASPERWNPVAAIVLRGVELPPGITPHRADLRIPVPNLYGFATSASVVLLNKVLYAKEAGEVRPVPFCEPLTVALVQRHRPFFADLRAPRSKPPAGNFLCLAPALNLQARFRHAPLAAFVDGLLHYLGASRELLRRELDLCADMWRNSGDAWWLMRIGHIHEGLGEPTRAREVYATGASRYPGRPEFRALLARVVDSPHDRAASQVSNPSGSAAMCPGPG